MFKYLRQLIITESIFKVNLTLVEGCSFSQYLNGMWWPKRCPLSITRSPGFKDKWPLTSSTTYAWPYPWLTSWAVKHSLAFQRKYEETIILMLPFLNKDPWDLLRSHACKSKPDIPLNWKISAKNVKLKLFLKCDDVTGKWMRSVFAVKQCLGSFTLTSNQSNQRSMISPLILLTKPLKLAVK